MFPFICWHDTHHGFLKGKKNCGLQENYQNCWITDAIQFQKVNVFFTTKLQVGAPQDPGKSLTRSWGAGAVYTCLLLLWLHCRSSVDVTCQWKPGANQSGWHLLNSFPGLHPLSPKGLTTSDCSPGELDFEPMEKWNLY